MKKDMHPVYHEEAKVCSLSVHPILHHQVVTVWKVNVMAVDAHLSMMCPHGQATPLHCCTFFAKVVLQHLMPPVLHFIKDVAWPHELTCAGNCMTKVVLCGAPSSCATCMNVFVDGLAMAMCRSGITLWSQVIGL